MSASSDVAIVILNYYPPDVLQRAVDSVRRQSFRGRVTLYIGFHARDAAHQRVVRTALAGLPVHYVTIERDMVFDQRPRDRILQEALRVGDHRFLCFLDDDDEWYPTYLEKMTAPNAPFVTCAKDVERPGGAIRTVRDDPDYTSMIFHFALWRGRSLPYFVKQIGDKYVHREFSALFPEHPVIEEPLYRVHEHDDSLTFRKTLGRGGLNPEHAAQVRVLRDGPDCVRIAAVLGDTGADDRTIVVCPASRVGTLRPRPRAVVAVVSQPPETLQPHQLARLRHADALLLADPAWIETLETIHPICLPVGIPSQVPEEKIAAAAMRDRPRAKKAVAAIVDDNALGRSLMRQLRRHLPPEFTVTRRLAGSDVCWCPDVGRACWGRHILEAYERGIPCVTGSRTSIAKILWGGSALIADRNDPAVIAGRLTSAHESAPWLASLPFFRRCYGAYYWRNSFFAYLNAAFPSRL